MEQLRQVRQAISRKADSLKGLEAEHGATLEAAGLSFEQIVMLTLDFAPLDSAISQKKTKTGSDREVPSFRG